MLAGRLDRVGPFGWNAQSPDLESRIDEGMHLHRWHQGADTDERWHRLAAIEAFLRAGLVAPVQETSFGDLERRGKEIFESREAQCANCHEGGGSDGELHRIELDPRPGFLIDDEPFKTPPLHFIGGTAPYFHDGSAATLRDVLRGDRMGHTSHLSEADKTALISYLETL